MTVAAVLALAVVGTGAAFAYRTFVGSPRSGEPPIIRADNSPTKVVPRRRMRRQDPRPHAVERWRREAGVARRDAGRRQFEVRRTARGVSAVEPERQPAAGLKCFSVGADAAAATGTMPNNEPRRIRRSPSRASADNGGIPAGANAPPPRPAPPTRNIAAPGAAPAAARRVTLRRPMPAPIRRCRSRRRRPKRSRRPAWPRPTRRRPPRLQLPRVEAVSWSR